MPYAMSQATWMRLWILCCTRTTCLKWSISFENPHSMEKVLQMNKLNSFRKQIGNDFSSCRPLFTLGRTFNIEKWCRNIERETKTETKSRKKLMMFPQTEGEEIPGDSKATAGREKLLIIAGNFVSISEISFTTICTFSRVYENRCSKNESEYLSKRCTISLYIILYVHSKLIWFKI